MSDSDSDSGQCQWAVFLTAKVPTKVVNRALLLIQGFEFSENLGDGNWTLLTSEDLSEKSPPPTSAPLTKDQRNDFAGKSLAEVNTFVRSNAVRLEELGFVVDLWLVLDDAGLVPLGTDPAAASTSTSTSNGVLCKQCFAGGDEDEIETWGYTDDFETLRAPLDQTWEVFAGLNSGAEFLDFQDTDCTVQADGTTKFNPEARREVTNADVLERKRKAWHAWRDQGFIE
ncbi:hypothetical protein DFH07DRAFT_142549 [Mycena maculata]|uniref:Uncharacterized protein n=1 Tax=Mycena maculata TaxID=230809 RepID=A0AAD7MUR0_9AGAR|nr:hypothetical protein DFH07DRAFT_142549 [Mycena maculata]